MNPAVLHYKYKKEKASCGGALYRAWVCEGYRLASNRKARLLLSGD